MVKKRAMGSLCLALAQPAVFSMYPLFCRTLMIIANVNQKQRPRRDGSAGQFGWMHVHCTASPQNYGGTYDVLMAKQ